MNGASSVLSKSVEPNSIASAAVLLFGVLIDGALAVEPLSGEADCPSSLRTSSFVAVLAFASPEVRAGLLVDQRLVLGVLVVGLACAGLNVGSIWTRFVDVLFSSVVSLGCLWILTQGGVESAALRPDAPTFNAGSFRRRMISGLSEGLMVYLGARCVRSGFVCGDMARRRTVSVDAVLQITAVDFGASSAEHALALSFGGMVAVCAGFLAGLNRQAEREGTPAVAFQVGVAGAFVAIAALWATITQGQVMDLLHSLYGPAACNGHHGTCSHAASARRFVMANSGTVLLWTLALGMMVFAFSVESRAREPATQKDVLWRRQGYAVGVVCLGAASASIGTNLSFEGETSQTDICTLLVILAVFMNTFGDTMIGSSIYVGAMVFEEFTLVAVYGFQAIFVHLTHLSTIFMLLSTALYLVVSLTSAIFARCLSQRAFRFANYVMALLGTFGTSTAFALYLATTVLMATNNGYLPGDALRDNSGRRTMIAFALQHFLPLFAFAPIYSSRSEVLTLDSYSRAIAWLLSVPLVLLVYLVSLVAMQLSAPSASAMNMETALPVGAVGLLTWTLAAFV